MLVFDRTVALVPTLKVKRLYGEPPVSLLPAAPAFRNMGIVLPHNSGFVDLKLSVEPF